jgi:FkbM family methyltransferase
MTGQLFGRAIAGRVIRQLYLGLLGREPDTVGLQMFLRALKNGTMTVSEVAAALVQSKEFAGRRSDTVVREPDGCLAGEVEAVCRMFADPAPLARQGYVTDFTGVMTDVRVIAGLAALSGTVEGLPIPGNFHGEAIEWLWVLKSVLGARDTYVILELGAGWGPWCAIAHRAARRREIMNIHVVAVEGDAGHVQFIRNHFAVNNIPEADATIVHGVVGMTDGTAEFPRHRVSSTDYGGAAAFGEGAAARSNLEYFVALRGDNVAEVERLPCFSLSGLLLKFPTVDLVHCDIQGGELDVLSSAMPILIHRVRRIIVGTHSHKLDRDVAVLLARAGWLCEGLTSAVMHQQQDAAVGIRDGCQVWANPALLSFTG